MAQSDFGNLESPLSGTSFINTHLEPWRDAVHSTHSGGGRPSYAVAGMIWLDTTDSSRWIIYIFDGSEDIKIGEVDTTNDAFIPAGGSKFLGTAAGTANALTLAPTPTITALATGDVFDFIVGTTNTNAGPTLAINALDAETIKTNIGSGKVNCPKGALVAGTAARVLWDGTDFILMNVRPYNKATDIATASTINLDAALGDYLTLTGTTTVNTITLAEGQSRLCHAGGAFTLVNSASLILPTSENIDVVAGDVFMVRGEASGVVRVVNFMRADGTALGGGAGGMVLLSEQTASGDSELVFDNTVFTSDYDEYVVVGTQLNPTSDGDDFRMQVSEDNGTTFFTDNYSYIVRAASSNGGFDTYNSASDNRINITPNTSNYGVGGNADESLSFTMHISNPLSEDPRPLMYWTAGWYGPDSRLSTMYASASRRGGAGDANFNAVRYYFDSNNIDAGTIRVYGVKKS